VHVVHRSDHCRADIYISIMKQEVQGRTNPLLSIDTDSIENEKKNGGISRHTAKHRQPCDIKSLVLFFSK
jgi:hypothetical protein